MNTFLKIQQGLIADQKGNPVILHGINLGGWLMPEGYFMHAPNRGHQFFRKKFIKECGIEEYLSLEKAFRDNWIVERDIESIAQMGFNCLRIPFHFRLIESEPYVYDLDGVGYLDRVIRWAKKYDLGVILDMHAAPGGQSADWHCDSNGKARFWNNSSYQKRACALWSFLAERYKKNKTVIGYDLLNEADALPDQLNRIYRDMIESIRSVDSEHLLFIEGNKWATDLSVLENFDDSNICLSIHYYEPIDFTFNLVPNLTYPLPAFSKKNIKDILLKRIKIAQQRNLPVLVGEYGIHTRADRFNESRWLDDTLNSFNHLGLHRTYWTYKAIKNAVFPDGLMSYYPNDPWVNRHGPLTGWDTWYLYWKKNRQEMIRSWRTEHFEANQSVIDILKKYAS